ncbi:hypothetical protein P4B35_12890 [Pontiellaceae bacterium B12227]|nr:hypothetical protein [Pontiellaceae bacterium B12227]
MKKHTPFYAAFALLLLAGCASKNKYGEEKFLTEREQKAALAKTKPPQYFGFAAFPAQGGIDYRGYARLHPNHQAEMDFENNKPVIKIRGRANRLSGMALLDFSSAMSWMEFSKASDFDAVFMGMNEDVIPYRGQFSGDVNAYAAVVSQIRIDQLFMENVPLFVRMSVGGLGPYSRNIFDPTIDTVFGYDILGLYETIQLNLRDGHVIFSTSHPYTPNEDLLMSSARIKNVKGYGLCVEGAIFGQTTPIVLDVAGEYHFARSDKKVSQTKQVSLGDVVYRKVPTMLLPPELPLPRAGRLMLEKYIITICPTQGFVYFERFPE